MPDQRRCKDCEPGSKRPAPHPGPRCSTHNRQRKQELRDRAHAAHIAATYGGLTANEYRAMYQFQGETCAICRRATGKTRRLAVDHDHQTGRVRGLLCRPCNKMLGHGRDDPSFFRRAAGYLTVPPAVAAGVARTVEN